MSILFFICGWNTLARRDVPPAVMGGSIRHIVSEDIANLIGILLMIPLVMDVMRVCGLLNRMPDTAFLIYIAVSTLLPVVAVIIYYVARRPRPVTEYSHYLYETDIPADKVDIAQSIANRAYFSSFLLLLSLLFPLTYIAAPFAIALSTQAIRRSNENLFARPQRLWAQWMRGLSILALILPTVCVLTLTFAGPQVGGALVAANLIEPTRRPTLTPVPTPTLDLSSDASSNPTPEGGGVQRIAFVVIVEFETISHIYTVNPDGTDLQRLTEGDTLNMYPAWSPDGQSIVFMSDRDGGEYLKLYRMNADGSDVTRLIDTDRNMFQTAWSPDGTQIAFTMETEHDGTTDNDIFVINADGTRLRNLTDEPYSDEQSPSWSPDGSQLVYSAYGNLYLINADGSGKQILLEENINYSAAWSPNGQWIAYSEYDTLGFIRPDGTGQTSIQLPVMDVYDFSWSPDSQSIVFSPDEYSDTSPSLYIVDVEGADIIEIPIDEDGIFTAPAWQQP